MSRRRNNSDKTWYVVTLEGGFIIALLVMIAAFTIPYSPNSDLEIEISEQEVVDLEEIPRTEHEEKAPPPPRPPVPVEVPNDEVLDDVELNLDASLEIGEETQDLPPPPPPEEEEKGESVEEEPEPEIFVVVEQMPELIGGLQSIQKKIKYPPMARNANVQGRVFVQFVVDEEGNVRDPIVTKGIGGGCDEEALRVVRQAKFTPGKQRGKPVRVKMSIPITFRLK